MKKVLILGGGFGGVEAAIELNKKGKFDVTLISDRDYLYLFPISIWIPTHETSFENAKISLQKIADAHQFRFAKDRVEEFNTNENKIVCNTQSFSYDYLIIGIGASKLTAPGIENTLSICGHPETGLLIRAELDALVQKGSGKIAMGFGGNPKDKSAVRGGPGFELLFNVHNYLKKKGVRNNFELNFFAPMPQPGAKMGPGALSMMAKMFRKYDIKQKVGVKIAAFTPDGIDFEDKSVVASDFTMFIPASKGHDVITNSDLPVSDAGFIKIDKHCLVEGLTNVYAIGDVAALGGPNWGAKQGHMAEIMGRVATYNIVMNEIGDTRRKEYLSHISIICIMDTGDGAAFVYRNSQRNFVIPMPVVGHWLKKGWGTYIKWTKLGKIGRLPGM